MTNDKTISVSVGFANGHNKLAIGSATLDKVEVKEIGLRSLLMSLTVGAFRRGETSPIFQALGILHSEKEELRISATGAARISANSHSTQFGRSSGPPARAQLMYFFA